MDRDKEQSRSSAASAEVAVSIGLVLAWLFGALLLFVVVPSGPQVAGRGDLSALRGIQLADQRVPGHRFYLGAGAGFLGHDREVRSESEPKIDALAPGFTAGSVDTGSRDATDWSQPRAVCQSEASLRPAIELSC